MKNIMYLHAGAELYGADIVLLELVSKLDKTKFTPYVVLPNNGPLVDKMKAAGIDVDVVNYPILRRKYFNIKGIFKYVTNYMKYVSKLSKIAKEKDIDIIHVNTAAVLEGIYIKKKIKKKMLWHIHEIILKPKILSEFLIHLISKYSDITISVSNAVKDYLEQSKKFNDIMVIHNGVDNEVFNKFNETEYLREEFKIPQDALVVGMIGRVNAWKGQKDFLKALDIVMENNHKIYGVMVGGVFEGQEWRLEELRENITKMKNGNRIIMDDYRKDSKNIHCLFDVFVLPSTNPDPLPTVVLEAMASGKPVVGYRHGGICEMVSENESGLLAEVGDFKDLAKNIEILVKNDKMRESMGDKSLIRQKNYFSLDSYVSNFEEVYLNL